ncbi:MAG: hypothetical protein K8I29_17940, partial [Alphaproteobacteria bacterium]|nr:hypothetical protein [Candidatus Nitrobium versatile]
HFQTPFSPVFPCGVPYYAIQANILSFQHFFGIYGPTGIDRAVFCNTFRSSAPPFLRFFRIHKGTQYY